MPYTVVPQRFAELTPYAEMGMHAQRGPNPHAFPHASSPSVSFQLPAPPPHLCTARRPNATSGNPGRTYRFLDQLLLKPLWWFGHGLSYTSFDLRFAQVCMRSMSGRIW